MEISVNTCMIMWNKSRISKLHIHEKYQQMINTAQYGSSYDFDSQQSKIVFCIR